jgi:hypothetical protein
VHGHNGCRHACALLAQTLPLLPPHFLTRAPKKVTLEFALCMHSAVSWVLLAAVCQLSTVCY